MALLKILQYPDPRLQRIAKPVAKIDEHVQKVIDRMFATKYHTENCAALAATQLDLPYPPHITVIDLSPTNDQPLCLINAEIIARKGEQFELEGCMSVMPSHIHERVKRAAEITVQALDRHGKTITLSAEGYMAKCIQHELDHLAGKLYIDHLSALKRERIRNKISKINKKT
ncbi:MAG: def1 [Gammaproteobacteria bacterium]|jgi:peptide deformylase|nr:def1 [Gammaproteobacteria bacterium]